MGNTIYIQISVIAFMVTVFYAVILFIIRRGCSITTTPVYERSFYLIMLANISNYFEAICNLIVGSFVVKSKASLDDNLLIVLSFTIYSTRIYASCMILRLYRIQLLHKFRLGEVSRDSMIKRSSLLFISILTNAYALVMFSSGALLVFLFHFGLKFMIYWNSTCYAIEVLILLFLSLKGINYTHPTIYIEYIFYSIIWAVGTISYDNNLNIRLFFLIPIRNCTLLLITLFSLYEHIKILRPPLPLDLNLGILFEFSELYENFKDFVMKKGVTRHIKACEIYINLSKATFMNSLELFEISRDELRYFDDELARYIENSQYDCIKDYIENTLAFVLKEYEDSDHYAKFRKQYYVIFN
ncbi:hypothetical protein SteCoe_12233 [Stentor coeruleus]|uniref:RGS domain-containing protein n=1 Tax=Stentor coeruleus TaxID=5963 RepID=A0A1R2CB77_9CILI|nr:hypothetical protein SteCoe_12233 [Stentor coeruleus]